MRVPKQISAAEAKIAAPRCRQLVTQTSLLFRRHVDSVQPSKQV
jgi:hypothetical protein